MAQVTTVEITSIINKIKDSNSEETVHEALGIFLKLITNIIKAPHEEKFKVIKKSNKVIAEKWYPCIGVEELAVAVGYEAVDEQILNFAGEIENLSILKEVIEAVMSESPHLHPSKTPNSDLRSNQASHNALHQSPLPGSHEPIQHDPSKKTISSPSSQHISTKDLQKTSSPDLAHVTHKEIPGEIQREITPVHPELPPKAPSVQTSLPKGVQKPAEVPSPEKKAYNVKPVQEGPEPDYTLEWSGSSYIGPLKDGWFEGKGRFRFPSGVIYEGEFHKGEFHGKGVLIFPNGGKYKASWDHGRTVDGEYEYYDGLIYDAKDWNYCQIPDRRFYTEIKEGLRPAGATLLVNDAKGPKAMVPGTYDVGEGYYDMNKNMVFTYEGEEIAPPEDADLRDILNKYRYNPSSL